MGTRIWGDVRNRKVDQVQVQVHVEVQMIRYPCHSDSALLTTDHLLNPSQIIRYQISTS